MHTRSLHRYGAALGRTLLFAMLVGQTTLAQTFTVIHVFTGGGDGAIPQAGLTMDAAGNFYGTASSGGYQGSGPCAPRHGCGVVFKLTHHGGSSWTVVPFYTFQGGTDGDGPLSRVVFGPDGALYGTTYGGGIPACSATDGCGVVYRVTPLPQVRKKAFCSGSETIPYSFSGGSDAANPYWGDLTFDRAGNLFGTTLLGGTNNAGAVFKLAYDGHWTESVLYSFAVETGAYPQSGVTFDSAGTLYGTAANYGLYGYGMVYQLIPSGLGWTENTIYSFRGADDGGYPIGGVIFDSAGNLYGATVSQGAGTNGGTVYRLTNSGGSWSFSTLTSLSGGAGGPYDRLTMDAAGNLYGTTYNDGAYGYGSVFRLTPQGDGSWLYTDLHDFTPASADGRNPVGSVLVDAGGNLFGTASYGGDRSHCETVGCGVVWEITP